MSQNDPSWPDNGDTPPGGSGGTPPSSGGGTPPPPPGGGGMSGSGMTGGGASAAGAGKTGPGGRPLASFGERAIALLIDWALLFAVGIVLFIFSGIVGAVSDILGFLVGLVVYALLFIGSIALFVMGEGGPLGQTPGKHMRGIQVVKEDGSQLDTGGAVIRYLGRILDTIVCGLPIGYLWPLFDDEERCWHDMIASTRVVTGGPQGGPQEWFAKFRG